MLDAASKINENYIEIVFSTLKENLDLLRLIRLNSGFGFLYHQHCKSKGIFIYPRFLRNDVGINDNPS